jgi:hypothetical protein
MDILILKLESFHYLHYFWGVWMVQLIEELGRWLNDWRVRL